MSLTFVGRTTKRTTKINLGFSEQAITVNKKGRIGISMGLAVEMGLSTGKSFMFAYDDLNKKAYIAVYPTTTEDTFSFETGTESYFINKKFHAEKLANMLGLIEESTKLAVTKTVGTTDYDLYEVTNLTIETTLGTIEVTNQVLEPVI